MDNGLGQRELERDLRVTWLRLISQALPNVARGRNWPVSTAEGFERVLLDHVQEVARIAPDTGLPRDASAIDLVFAIEMGAKVLNGQACVAKMNRSSLAKRSASHDRD